MKRIVENAKKDIEFYGWFIGEVLTTVKEKITEAKEFEERFKSLTDEEKEMYARLYRSCK